MAENGGSGRKGMAGACALAEGINPVGRDANSRGVGGGSLGSHVKNKQWTRRVDGLTRRDDPDTGLVFSNWLKFSLKKSCNQDGSCFDLVEEEDEMGNLQGGDSKKNKDTGKSPVKEKKRGFLLKKPGGAKNVAPMVSVSVPQSQPSSAPRALQMPTEHQHNGTRPVEEEVPSVADMAEAETANRLFSTESWRAVNQAESRESSSESIFMDPLTSPRVPDVPEVNPPSEDSISANVSLLPPSYSDNLKISMAPQETSTSSSLVHSRTDSSSSTHRPDDTSSLDDVTLIEEDGEDTSESLAEEKLDEPISEAMTEPVVSTQRPTSFTVKKHRKVELGSVSGSLLLQNDPSRRHSSVSDVPTDSNVLRKVASLTLDGNSTDQKLSRPKVVPEKLDYHIYDKFEGQQLLNWFASSFPDDHYLKMLLTSQDLRIIGTQFCTHMLAAGVLRQIPDKDAPIDPIFRPDLMYVWTHSETSAITPATPGRIPAGMWSQVTSPGGDYSFPRPGAKYTEADARSSCLSEGNSMTASTASVDKVIRKIEAEEFQQTIIGLKREHKDNLVKMVRGQEVKMFTLRGEHAHTIQEQEERIVELLIEVQQLKQELERNQTIAQIQDLTKNALYDFDSPISPKKNTLPTSAPADLHKTEVSKSVSASSIHSDAADGSVISSQVLSTPSQLNNELCLRQELSDAIMEDSKKTDDTSNRSTASQVIEEENVNKVPSSIPINNVPSPSEQQPKVSPVSPSAQPAISDNIVPNSIVEPVPDSIPQPIDESNLPPPMPGFCPPPPPMPGATPSFPEMPVLAPPPPPMPGIVPPPPPMLGMGPPPPPMPGMGPPPPPMPGMGPPPPPMPGMGPPPPPMPGMGPPPPPMPGMGPAPPPMPGMGPPPPPMSGICPPPMPGGSVPTAPGPPPPPFAGPSPLPAPPVGGWNAQRATLRKPPLTPAVPMKPLFWSRIIVPVGETTPSLASPSEPVVVPLWENLEETPIEDLSEFNTLFSRQIITRKVTKKKTEEPARTTAAKILDSKRSQNVGILASSLHVDFSEIENAVYNFDTSVVSLEALHQIYEVRASPDELAMMKGHVSANPYIPLDKPEQFLLELSEIPNFAERIACFMFQSEYEDIITGIDSKLNNIKSVCEILCGDGVKTIMATVLALGNYMNGGNMARGQADGFALDILPRLRDVKSTDSSVTLLHFLVRTILRRSSSDSPLPLPEPGDIARAALVDAAEVSAELLRLENDLNTCERKMESVIAASSEDNLQPFKQKMDAFLESARLRLKGERDNLEECQLRFKTTAKFYQFRPKSADEAVSEFFGIWSPFAKDFKDIWKKEQQKLIKEKMQEIKKKQDELKKEVRPVKAGGLKDKMRQRLSQNKSSS